MFAALLHLAPLAILALFAVHAALVVFLGRRRASPMWAAEPVTWPAVTVQIAVCNERALVAGAVESVFRLDYPRELLHVQICDDSTDAATVAECERLRELGRSRGIRVEHLRRESRDGFKAGNLNHALRKCDADFVAVLDVDFRVPSDFLVKNLPALVADDSLAAVQTHWVHSNREANLLTQALDSAYECHLLVEQPARTALGLWTVFTGSAGIWRRAAIESLGGWCETTGTEDLDLSFRAQTAGWRIRFSDATTSTALLPDHMPPFLEQQARWAQSCGEILRRCLIPMLRARPPLWARLQGLLHLGGYFCHLAVTCLLLTTWLVAKLLAEDPSRRWVEHAALLLLVLMLIGGGVVGGETARRAGHRGAVPRAAHALVTFAQSGIALLTSVAFLRGLSGARLAEWHPSNAPPDARGNVPSPVHHRLFQVLALGASVAGILECMRHGLWAIAAPALLFTPGVALLVLDIARLPALGCLRRKDSPLVFDTPEPAP